MGLFLAADIRVASESATFTAPDMSGGLVAGWGLNLTLPRLLGPGRALEFLWSSRTVAAPEALQMGLIDRLLPDDQWEQEVFALTQRGCRNPQPACLTKLAVQQSLPCSTSPRCWPWNGSRGSSA
ncbi:MAG: enoyl-CoA hydratase/isomerase family protein, partial [bacterium]|nr:enoyl-CoA hydratase/isomerase family protein [bacterium]